MNKLENGWNGRGLPARDASRATSGGAVLNEVAWEYSDFNKPVTEYQEHSGPVKKIWEGMDAHGRAKNY